MSQRAKDICQSSVPDRWMAEIIYTHGGCDIFRMEELEEIDEIVERGPDWNTIDRIVITLNRPTLTIQWDE
jgi:hypothetical protein